MTDPTPDPTPAPDMDPDGPDLAARAEDADPETLIGDDYPDELVAQ